MLDKLLKLNLQHFAEETPEDQTSTNDSGGTTEETTGTTTETVEEKTFTQEDLNKIAAKEKKAAKEAFLKELGIADFKSAKEGMEKFREWQESQKTEQEQLNDKLETYETQIGKKDTTISDLQAENEAIKSGITEEKNLEAVITLAKTKVNDDVDIKEAIKQVVEDYPQFAGEQQEEEPKPSFSTGNHQKQTNGKLDAFEAKLAKYK